MSVLRGGSGRQARIAYTMLHVVVYLWECLVSSFDKYIKLVSSTIRTSDGEGFCIMLRRLFDGDGSAGAWLIRLICSGLSDDRSAVLSPTSTDECADQIAEYCLFGLGVQIDIAFVRDAIAPFCIALWEPSQFLAKTLVRCEFMEQVMGSTLSKRLRIFMHNEQFGFEVPDADINVQDALLVELLAAKRELARVKAAVARGFTLIRTPAYRVYIELFPETLGGGLSTLEVW
jgi:hypothetical protein